MCIVIYMHLSKNQSSAQLQHGRSRNGECQCICTHTTEVVRNRKSQTDESWRKCEIGNGAYNFSFLDNSNTRVSFYMKLFFNIVYQKQILFIVNWNNINAIQKSGEYFKISSSHFNVYDCTIDPQSFSTLDTCLRSAPALRDHNLFINFFFKFTQIVSFK